MRLVCRGGESFDPCRHCLRFETELGRAKGVCLRHGVFGAMETIEDQFAKKRKADDAMTTDVMFAAVIDQIKVVTFFLPRDVEVFAQFDVAGGPKDEGPAIAPRAQSIGIQPIDAD